MGKIQSYRDLQVWQRAVTISVDLYQVTNDFPKSEIYGLTSQKRRAAVSIASNIAEGFNRTNPEFARYLNIARGSLAELETQLEIARQIGYLPQDTHDRFADELDILSRQFYVLYQRVSQNKRD